MDTVFVVTPSDVFAGIFWAVVIVVGCLVWWNK